MSKVNVVLDDGTVVAVDESVVEHAASMGVDAHEESAAGEQTRQTEDRRHEKYGGVVGGLISAGAGALDTLTLGGYGKAIGALGDATGLDLRGEYQDVAQEHPDARTAGELGSLLVPGLGELGAASKVGETAKATAELAGYGEAAGKIGHAAEGIAYGVGGTIAGSNASGDPLTIQSLAEGATIGGLLGYGSGVLADHLGAASAGAQAEIEAETKAATGTELFSKPSPAYEDLVTARDAAVSEAKRANAVVAKDAAAMEKYAASTEDFIRDRNGFNKALNEVYAGATNPRGVPLGWDVDQADALDTMQRSAKIVNKATAVRNTDINAAVDMLRPVREELAQKFDIIVPDLPRPVGKMVSVPDSLPNSLEKFARLRPDTVAKAAANVTPAEQQALQGLLKELDLGAGTTAGGTLADVHASLAQHASAIDGLKAATGPSNSLLVRTLKWAARKAGRKIVGGVTGGVLGGPLGAAVGATIGGMLGHDMVTAATMEARSGIREKIRGVVAKYAGPASRGAGRLGPVSAYLSASFPSGKKDRASDLGELAKNRSRDLASAALTAPDSMYTAVQPIIGIPGDIGLKVHQHVIRALTHTATNAPKDPGFSPHGTGSDWKPSSSDALALAYRLEALQAPLSSIARLLSGEVHPAAVDALKANWPALVAATAEELMGHVDTLNKLSPERAMGHSALLGNPMSGLSVPENILALQAMYLPGASDGRQPQPTHSPGTAGRPPKAGPSTVAGSNVDSLITQG